MNRVALLLKKLSRISKYTNMKTENIPVSSEVRIYKRKQESKKKHALNQENDEEKKRKDFSFLLDHFLAERVFSFFFS